MLAEFKRLILSIKRRFSVWRWGCCLAAVAVAAAIQTPAPPAVFSNYHLTGAVDPVRDPSVIRQNEIPITRSALIRALRSVGICQFFAHRTASPGPWCGTIFTQIPPWVVQAVPGILGLWAPDISYFNGLYHVYYAGSAFGSNTSVIGLATNTTLDSTDPNYQWVDQGAVLGSNSTDDFNAIDPNILVDTDGSVWLTYGSYWSGIKQRQIDPTTGGLLSSNTTVYSLAYRPNVQYDMRVSNRGHEPGAQRQLLLLVRVVR